MHYFLHLCLLGFLTFETSQAWSTTCYPEITIWANNGSGYISIAFITSENGNLCDCEVLQAIEWPPIENFSLIPLRLRDSDSIQAIAYLKSAEEVLVKLVIGGNVPAHVISTISGVLIEKSQQLCPPVTPESQTNGSRRLGWSQGVASVTALIAAITGYNPQ